MAPILRTLTNLVISGLNYRENAQPLKIFILTTKQPSHYPDRYITLAAILF